ncbi:MAG: hypothetical protein K9J13_06180 [Saprospiraceae bacterium]|nr:hypothetical protein [Saprospiraceae bacterium]
MFLHFIDGYYIFDIDQSINVEMYVLPCCFIIIAIILFIINKRKKVKEKIVTEFLFLVIVIFLTYLIGPIFEKVQIYGFKTRVEHTWNLEKLFQCSEQLIDHDIKIISKQNYKVYEIDNLPNCFAIFLSKKIKINPKIVVDRWNDKCTIGLEFKNYSIKYIPQGFRAKGISNSTKNKRIYFSYSIRINRSWRLHEIAESEQMYKESIEKSKDD